MTWNANPAALSKAGWRAAAALALAAGCAGAPAEQRPPPEAPRAETQLLFRFESGFWINLHHVLYESARRSVRGETWPARDLGAEWDEAVAYYRAEVIHRDLLFDDELYAVKAALSGADPGAPPPAEVPARLAAALEAAAPAYRARLWTEHDAENRRWIAGVTPLLEQHGPAMAARLTALFRHPWPAEPIPVDVVYVANWAGAYTTIGPPHVVLGSSSPGNQEGAALETTFHEGSHVLIDEVQETLQRLAQETGVEAPRDLWHAVLFYTVGEVARDALGPSYTPYAEKHGLWTRGDWPRLREAIVRGWRPWMAGEASFEDALRAVLAAAVAGRAEGAGSPR